MTIFTNVNPIGKTIALLKWTIVVVAILAGGPELTAASEGFAGDFDQGRFIASPGKVIPWRDRVDPVNKSLVERWTNYSHL